MGPGERVPHPLSAGVRGGAVPGARAWEGPRDGSRAEHRAPHCWGVPSSRSSRGWKGRGSWYKAMGHRSGEGCSPPARGAQVFRGSRSLQVNPGKGTTRDGQSDLFKDLSPNSPAQAQASGCNEDAQGWLYPGGIWPSLVQATVKGTVVTPLNWKPGLVWSAQGPPPPHTFRPGGTTSPRTGTAGSTPPRGLSSAPHSRTFPAVPGVGEGTR